MAFGKKDVVNFDKTETLIGKGTRIEGTITADVSLRVDGEVNGEIKTSGDLVVGETGVITANVKARNVFLAGKIDGNIDAAGRLEMVSTGTLNGEISVGKLIIGEGAHFYGKCIMREQAGNGAAGEQSADLIYKNTNGKD